MSDLEKPDVTLLDALARTPDHSEERIAAMTKVVEHDYANYREIARRTGAPIEHVFAMAQLSWAVEHRHELFCLVDLLARALTRPAEPWEKPDA